MSTRKDLFDGQNPPDRLYYATGVFLDAEDLEAEQTYHRGRVARVLDYLHGYGTVAGLTVDWGATSTATDPRQDEERLIVTPGMAIDRLGRIIEVPRTVCLDLRRWWAWQADRAAGRIPFDPAERGSPDDLARSFAAGAVTVDVFLNFVACDRGKTPAFAEGPFDATDAVQPSRIRDGYAVELVIRRPSDTALPARRWEGLTNGTTFEDWLRELQDEILDSWRHGTDAWSDGPPPGLEHREGWDPTAVLLARVTIAASAPVGDAAPARTLAAGVPVAPVIDNRRRPFVYSNAALVQWLIHARARTT